MNDYYQMPNARKTVLALAVALLCLCTNADAAVFEFGWGVKLGFAPDPQMAAQRHEAKMMRMQVQHEQRMARYSRPAAVQYRRGAPVGYEYSGGTIYYQGRTTYAPPRVYYYYQTPQSNVRYYH